MNGLGAHLGRKVKTITFADGGEMQFVVCAQELYLQGVDDGHGLWVLAMREGVEISRHNVACIETIVWE